MPTRAAAPSRTVRPSVVAAGARTSAPAHPPTFHPNDISTPHLYYEADRIRGLLDGAGVASWPDIGGLAGHFPQATGAKQPIFKQAGINGQPSVRFSATKGFQIPTLDLTSVGKVYVSMVIAGSSAADEFILEHSTDAITGNGFAICRLGATLGGQLELILGGTSGPYVFYSAEAVTATPKIVSCAFDHTLGQSPSAPNGAHEAIAWVNGSAIGGADVTNRGNTTNAVFAATSLNLGARNNATANPFTGDIGALFVGFGAPTADDIENLERYYEQKFGISRGLSNVNLVTEGTSLTCGFGSIGYTSNIPAYGLLALSTRIRHWNFATPSQKVADMTTKAPTRIDTKIRQGALNVLTMEGGPNDAGLGWQSAFDICVAYCAARKAAGWDKVGMTTLLPQADLTFNLNRNIFNDMVRAGVGQGYWDFVVDVGAEPHIGPDVAPFSTTYYGDGVHPNDAGQQWGGQAYAAALRTLGIS